MNLKNAHYFVNLLIFISVLVSLSQNYGLVVSIVTPIAFTLLIVALSFTTGIVWDFVDKPSYEKVPESYIIDNVQYSFIDDTTLKLQLDNSAPYPVVLGLKGEKNMGDLVESKRELQPGESLQIQKHNENEMLKEEQFTLYYNDSQETVQTNIDADFDGFLFCKTPARQSDIIGQHFVVEKGDML